MYVILLFQQNYTIVESTLLTNNCISWYC